MHAPIHTVGLGRNAMATRFEIFLPGEDPVAMQAAAEEALDEIERLDRQLNIYQPGSEMSRLNARAAHGPVKVEPVLFRLLQHAKQLTEETAGAFDITIAPLMRCWGFMRGTGRIPDPLQLEQARACVGIHHVWLDENDFTVRFDREGVMLDLGSIGKGFALDRAVGLLREAGVARGLIHGGTSTVCALGAPPGAEAWKVAIERPDQARKTHACAGLIRPHGPLEASSLLTVVPLKDASLSVSAIWGKSFEEDGKILGHVIDPRTGQPVNHAWLAAVVLPSAAETDALSTALLVAGIPGHGAWARLRPGIRSLVVEPPKKIGESECRTAGSGFEVHLHST
jgi:thiamine biosynthesis lipoprotein